MTSETITEAEKLFSGLPDRFTVCVSADIFEYKKVLYTVRKIQEISRRRICSRNVDRDVGAIHATESFIL